MIRQILKLSCPTQDIVRCPPSVSSRIILKQNIIVSPLDCLTVTILGSESYGAPNCVNCRKDTKRVCDWINFAHASLGASKIVPRNETAILLPTPTRQTITSQRFWICPEYKVSYFYLNNFFHWNMF